MKTIKFYIVIACVLFAGCEPEKPQDQQKQFPQVAEETKADAVKKDQQQKPQPKTDTETESAPKQVASDKTDTIKVTVKKLTVKETDFSAFDTLWSLTKKSFIVYKRPDIFHEAGIRFGVSYQGLSDQVKTLTEKAGSLQITETSLVIADGSDGYIDLGKKILLPEFYYLNRWYSQADYKFESTGRSFRILAKRIPDRDLVNLRIIPVFSDFLKDGSTKEFTELMTNITIKEGQSILIGSAKASYGYLANALLGIDAKTDKVIVIEANIH
jgi:hypothetical protein